jgi:regulator of sigma E protease
MSILLGIFLFLVIVIPLVVLHEYGHFLIAKRNGVDIEEFGVGFPPRLYGKTIGKGIWRAYYTINALPLGGFVKLKGENDADRRKGSFGRISFWAKARVLLAGVGMNYLIGLLLFMAVAAIRLPVFFDNQFHVASDTQVLSSRVLVAQVVPDSPAQKAGIQTGDRLVSLDGQTISSASTLPDLTKARQGQTVELGYEREGEQLRTPVKLAKNPADGRGYLGIAPVDHIERRATWSAPLVGFVVTHQLAWESLQALGSGVASLVTGDQEGAAQAGVTGPIGIVSLLGGGIDSLSQFMLIMGSISLSLAILNVLPIPALDGGRLALIALFRLIRRPLTARIEERVHGAGFIALLGLIVLVSIFDVQTLF